MILQAVLPVTDSAGRFDLIDGIPFHPLVVHAVVILLPLAAMGVIAMAVWPRFSRQYGWLVAICAVSAAGASWVARYTGAVLKDLIGAPGFKHETYGSYLPFFATVLMFVVLALLFIDRAAPAEGENPKKGMRTGVAALAVVVALGTLGWVGLVGHSGAKSVWTPKIDSASTTP